MGDVGELHPSSYLPCLNAVMASSGSESSDMQVAYE